MTDIGHGPPMVLIHGTPLDARAWDGLVPWLSRTHRVIAYDLRGHGSAATTPLPASADLLVEDLARLLDRLTIERAHVVGHSFGGLVAQVAAMTRPERCAALTVVCARSTPYPPFARAADTIERDGIAECRQAALARWFTPTELVDQGACVRYVLTCLTDRAGHTLATAFRLIAQCDVLGGLAHVMIPTRFIAAEHDQVAAPAAMRRAAAATPCGELVVVAGANHLLPLQHPRQLEVRLEARTP